MKFILIIISFFILNKLSFAQLTLERQVMSCFANETESSAVIITATAGESMVSTFSNSLGFITQGFHQPLADRGIQIQYTIYKNECDNTYEVDLMSITGCANLDSVEIFWNNVQGSTYQKLLPTISQLAITSPDGCYYNVVFDFLMMDVIDLPCDLIFYNYISPNGDGVNDRWNIEKIAFDYYANNRVAILNRWGTVIWEASNYDNTNVYWDGRSQSGENLPDGTYFFKVEVQGTTKSGFVELSR